MSTTTPVKTERTLIPVGTAVAASATVRGGVSLNTAHGGALTVKITNGGTAPTNATQCNILVSHTGGTLPALASAGAEWKTVYSFNGGTTANAITEMPPLSFGPDIRQLAVEIVGGNQATTAEALFTEVTSYSTTE